MSEESAPNVPAGDNGLPLPDWYADPNNPAELRRWDGERWTAETRPNPQHVEAAAGEPAPVKKGGVPTWAWIVGGIVALIILVNVLGGGEDETPAPADAEPAAVAPATLEGQIEASIRDADHEVMSVECRDRKRFCGAEIKVELIGAFDKTNMASAVTAAMEPMFADDRVLQGLVMLYGPTVTTGGKEGEGPLLSVTCDNYTVDSAINFDVVTLEGYRDLCEFDEFVTGIFD